MARSERGPSSFGLLRAYTFSVSDVPSVTIPDKPAFKASEVCELAQIQPYVLRSWESEFPELGLSKTPGGPRIYRRTDVERVLRIRDLVFTEGLTLSGVRRRFDAEQPQPQDDLFSFVAEVQAAQAKAAQANAERRTPSAEAASVTTPHAESAAPHTPRRTSHAKSAAASAASAQRELPGHDDASDGGGVSAGPPVPSETRAALVQLKQEMRSLLDLLGGNADASPARSPAPRRGKRG
jgi:DNA-binding transcriptional MerR regulator